MRKIVEALNIGRAYGVKLGMEDHPGFSLIEAALTEARAAQSGEWVTVPRDWRVSFCTSSCARPGDRWEVYDPNGSGGVITESDIPNPQIRGLLDALAASPPAPAAEPVAWFIDWPDKPDLGHYFAEGPAEGARNRPLVFGDTAPPPVAKEAEPVATDRERGIWRAAITLANNICVQECDRINDDDGPMPAIDATNQCAKRIRAWIDPADDQFAAMLTEAGVPAAPPPVAKAAEPFGWVLITGQGEVFRREKPDCLIGRWIPVTRSTPPPVEASQQQASADGVADYYLQRGLLRTARDEISRLTAERDALRRLLDGVPQDAIDGGWTARGMSQYCNRIEAELAAAKAEAEALRAAFVDTAKALGCEPDNEQMLAAIDALRKDSERYRWLRDQREDDGIAIVMKEKHIVSGVEFPKLIDRYIDAAIAAQQGEKE